MARRGRTPNSASRRIGSGRLSIAYAGRAPPPYGGRRVAYVRYAEPPITQAEIEIMRGHLDAMATSARGVANDPLQIKE